MTRAITKEQVAAVVREQLPRISFELPEDVQVALAAAFAREEDPRGAQALGLLLKNADIAREQRVPICQDTGSVWVCLEIGPDITVQGDVMTGVQQAVSQVYTECYLRKSMVRDALGDRTNTGDNTPAFTEIAFSERPGARLQIMCKGGGSDNASRVVMLAPGAGRAGIVDTVLECVRQKAANACPPLIIGVGVGATFDKVASLAKHALMRPLDAPTQNEQAASLEEELLQAVNATGIGAAALGGATTALGVRVNTAACHIAALPVAVNMGCSALRRGTYEL